MSVIFTKNAFFSFPEPWYRFNKYIRKEGKPEVKDKPAP
jgi:hypothetical protein